MYHTPKALSELSHRADELSYVYLQPTRILYKNESVGETDKLIKPSALQGCVNETLEIRANCSIAPGGTVVFDFGVELCGGIKLAIGLLAPRGTSHCRARFRFGESYGEVMAEFGEKNTTNDHALRDFTTELGFMSAPEIGHTGFRFVRIDNIDETASFVLEAICAKASFRDIEYKGSFVSNDTLLNKIFDTAAYTLHLCMQDYIWDGIKRDRAVWMGDMYPEAAALCCVFGDNAVLPKSLDLIRNMTAPDCFANGIYSYSLWWIWVQYRYYMQNGNIDYLSEQKEFLIRLVHQYANDVDETGALKPSGWCLFDWPADYDRDLEISGVHSLLLSAYEKAAFLLRELGESVESDFCVSLAAGMRKADVPDFDYKQISAVHALVGVRDAKTENERLLSKHGDSGISTFLGMFTYMARTVANDTVGALQNVRGVYGGMLSRGATSFWEDFDPTWSDGAGRIDEPTPDGLADLHGDRGAYCYVGYRHSLCHGWSAGVCAYLSEYVLGVKILEPGCRKVLLQPSLGDLERLDGTYPTPYGVMEIHCRKATDGTLHVDYTAPSEVSVTVAE